MGKSCSKEEEYIREIEMLGLSVEKELPLWHTLTKWDKICKYINTKLNVDVELTADISTYFKIHLPFVSLESICMIVDRLLDIDPESLKEWGITINQLAYFVTRYLKIMFERKFKYGESVEFSYPLDDDKFGEWVAPPKNE